MKIDEANTIIEKNRKPFSATPHWIYTMTNKIYTDFKLELEAEYIRGQDSILSRSCNGCKFGVFGIDCDGREIECMKNWQCIRAMPDRWEQK